MMKGSLLHWSSPRGDVVTGYILTVRARYYFTTSLLLSPHLSVLQCTYFTSANQPAKKGLLKKNLTPQRLLIFGPHLPMSYVLKSKRGQIISAEERIYIFHQISACILKCLVVVSFMSTKYIIVFRKL